MKTKHFSFVMIGVTVLSFGLVVASVVLGNHLLEARAAKLTELKLNERVLEEQQSSLARAKKDIAKYADLEKIAKTVVPQEKDQAKTVREIVNYATQTGVSIQSISFPTSNLGAATSATPVSGATTGTSTTPAAPSVTQVKPVAGLTGVYQLELIIQSDSKHPITFDQLNNFLSKLEQNRRTAQVSGININPVTTNRRLLTFTINLIVYIKP